MKKGFLFLLLFSLNIFASFCIDFNFSITPSFGILTGSYKEKLLYEINDDNKTISLLHWQIQAAPIANVSTLITLNNKFVIGLNGYYTIPSQFGQMEDFDWLNWYTLQTGELTNYSWHKNKLHKLFNIDVIIGSLISITKAVTIQPNLIFSYKYFYFDAIDGFIQYNKSVNDIYPEWTNDIPHKNLYGSIITYKGNEYSLGFGTTLNFLLKSNFKIATDINLLKSIKATSLDSHLKRNNSNGLFVYFNNSGKFILTTNISISHSVYKNGNLYTSGQYIYTVKNNSKIRNFSNSGAEISHIVYFTFGYTFTYEN